VIGGGLSVLRAVFDLLGSTACRPAQGALRHGVLYDMLDREQADTDVRTSTVQRLATKLRRRRRAGQRVGRVAALPAPAARARGTRRHCSAHERKLAWAAQLHEIGSADLAQRLPQARRLHPGQRRRPGLRAASCIAWACWCWGTAASCASWRRTSDDELFVQQLLACAWR
jgi:exopolyphosphatase/guanosine-5'-triphosphate,3'-diphosphate pyrophosphatase